MKKTILTFVLLVSSTTIIFSQSQSELNAQASSEYLQADKKLNQVYKQVMNNLSAPEIKAFISSQKAWITYRDLECKFEAIGNEGGSMYSMVFSSCMTDITKKRTQELKEILNTER